jgi:hypothetical protein
VPSHHLCLPLHISAPIAVDVRPAFSAAVLTGGAWIVDVGEGPSWTAALLNDVVSFLTARVAKAIGDPGVWSCAGVVGFVVPNFLSHLALLWFASVGAELRKNIAPLRTRCASDLAVLTLRTAGHDFPTFSWASAPDIRRQLIAVLHRVVARASKKRIAAIAGRRFVGDMVPDFVSQLRNPAYVSSLCASAGPHRFIHNVAAAIAAATSSS